MTTKLYNLEKGSKIKVEIPGTGEVVIIFDHVDGMYSYCYLESNHKRLVHLLAWTDLEKKDDYYEIVD